MFSSCSVVVYFSLSQLVIPILMLRQTYLESVVFSSPDSPENADGEFVGKYTTPEGLTVSAFNIDLLTD